MRFEIGFVLKFRHGIPVAFGHLRLLAFRIIALLDGDGIIKPLPKNAVIGFRFVGRGHLERLQGADDCLPGSVEQRLLVGAVIDEKCLLPVTGAEMAPQNGEYSVFGFDLTAQYTAQLRKPDESFQKVGLAVEVAYRGDDRVEGLVGKVSEETGTLF